KILAVTAQAVHHLVPPDALHPVIMTLANNFVSNRSSPEAIAAGLNTIREICNRQPLVMNKTLLQDLTLYVKTKNKYIMHAARGLITLFRRVDPSMLHKKFRVTFDFCFT